MMGSLDAKYPWPSTVNFASFVTMRPCLPGPGRLTNFNIWKEQMLCLLEGQGVLGFISGEIPPPEEAINTVPEESSSVEYEKKLWRRTDSLVKGWILGSIGKDALDAVCELETAMEVWLKLEEIFDNEEDDQSSQTSGDLNGDLPLYKAALRGDWDTAQDLYNEDNELITAIIGPRSVTALHAAVSTGKANDFVNKLVELMPPDALALTDSNGYTALHTAARVGNREAAMVLVNKNEDLLYIPEGTGDLPATIAAVCCRKEILEDLISCMESKPNVDHKPFEGQLGFRLLFEVIGSEFFDVALDLVEKYPHFDVALDLEQRHPHLAEVKAKYGLSVMDIIEKRPDLVEKEPYFAQLKHEAGLSLLAPLEDKNSAFRSGERFNWWQKLIYRRIPLKQRRASQASGDAPVYSFQRIFGVAKKLEFVLWKVIENLVPGVKGIREKKAVHHQALELVRCFCQRIVERLPENEARNVFNNSIMNASECGISEVVEEIIETYPDAATYINPKTGVNVFHLAASCRNENVFNLIYNLSDRKCQFFDYADSEDNNLMHKCGKLAPLDRLNLVPGAALQMQRELQWFKETEKFVDPSRRTNKNSEDQTPQLLFTKEHEKLKAEGERWMKETANACTIAAALIATVVFAGIFTVPGGVAAENGRPILSEESAFVLFAISDAVSLFTSITSLLMFLSILTARYAEEDFLYVLPKRLSIGLLSLFVSITFMMLAFTATLFLVFPRKEAWFLIPVAAFACLPVTSFVLLQFPLLVDVVYSTYGPGIFGKKSDRVLY